MGKGKNRGQRHDNNLNNETGSSNEISKEALDQYDASASTETPKKDDHFSNFPKEDVQDIHKVHSGDIERFNSTSSLKSNTPKVNTRNISILVIVLLVCGALFLSNREYLSFNSGIPASINSTNSLSEISDVTKIVNILNERAQTTQNVPGQKGVGSAFSTTMGFVRDVLVISNQMLYNPGLLAPLFPVVPLDSISLTPEPRPQNVSISFSQTNNTSPRVLRTSFSGKTRSTRTTRVVSSKIVGTPLPISYGKIFPTERILQ